MSEREDRAGVTAGELRAAFDAAFARPAEAPAHGAVALLALRAGGQPVAVRVLETAGLMAARPIAPVPSRRRELLGVAGVRGAIVPVYSLARLLGRADDGEPRWFVLADAGGERVALAASAFERHVLAPPSALRPAAHGAAEAYSAEALHDAGEVRPVLAIAALVRAITVRSREGE